MSHKVLKQKAMMEARSHQKLPLQSHHQRSHCTRSSRRFEDLRILRRSSKRRNFMSLLPLRQVMVRPMPHPMRIKSSLKRSPKTLSLSIMKVYLLIMSVSCQCPFVKPPHFDGMNYTKWSHNMKMHLISLNPSVWKVFCTGIEFLEEDESPTYEQLQ
jgi:hypothetical protein